MHVCIYIHVLINMLVCLNYIVPIFRGEKYIEMDINVHRFGSVPKKALQTLIGKYVNIIINL